jgi:hypothetical protein
MFQQSFLFPASSSGRFPVTLGHDLASANSPFASSFSRPKHRQPAILDTSAPEGRPAIGIPSRPSANRVLPSRLIGFPLFGSA